MQITVIDYDSSGRVKFARGVAATVFPKARITSINLRSTVSKYWVPKPNTKSTYKTTEEGREGFNRMWRKIAQYTSGVICFDFATATYILGEDFLKGHKDTSKIAGMVVEHEGIPVLFVNDPVVCYLRKFDPETQAQNRLQFNFHVKKLWRKVLGLPPLEKPVKFVVPKSFKELAVLTELAKNSKAMAVDIETTGLSISCIGFAIETDAPYTLAFVVPFYMNDLEGNGLYWSNLANTKKAMDFVDEIMESEVPKCYHNGSYDMAYQFRWRFVPNNFIFDTFHMMHSTWPSVSRKLYQGAAMFCDNFVFWKDDGKDAAEDDKTKKHYMPTTFQGHANYWKYNAHDCAFTLELMLGILRLWTDTQAENYPTVRSGFKYVWMNYMREMAVQFGPCMYMTMVGMKGLPDRQELLDGALTGEADEKYTKLQAFLGWDNFNPNSPKQVSHLYYDKLAMPALKRYGRTTDKRLVQVHADNHPVWEDVISRVHGAKEPANNASKYGRLPLFNDRLLYQLKAGTTTTWRLSSAKHNYKFGTNGQNYPKSMRVFSGADEGYILASADYSQSDSYFVAFESQDITMIETVTNDKDTHAEHVEFFFGSPYEEVVRGNENDEDWVVHPITGQRMIIKKVSHGTNYDMGGDTMLINVRKEAAVAMVKALAASKNVKLFFQFMGIAHISDVHKWNASALAKACEFAQRLYYLRYKKLAGWKKSAVNEATAQFGVVPMFGGASTVMLCQPSDNPRFVPAAYGQGGTAGNINNAMIRLYYLNEDMWQAGYKLVLQVHDEIVSQVPEKKINLLSQQKNIMEAQCEIHGRSFVVPVSTSISYIWSEKYGIKYDPQKPASKLIEAVKSKELKLLAELKAKAKKGNQWLSITT